MTAARIIKQYPVGDARWLSHTEGELRFVLGSGNVGDAGMRWMNCYGAREVKDLIFALGDVLADVEAAEAAQKEERESRWS